MIQPDGKMVIGGFFNQPGPTNLTYLARLNADGSFDSGFDIGTGPNNPVEALALQPDGKIVIGGLFSTYNTTNRGRIARVNPNGSRYHFLRPMHRTSG